MNYFYLDIDKVIPSQLYISKEKLKNVGFTPKKWTPGVKHIGV